MRNKAQFSSFKSQQYEGDSLDLLFPWVQNKLVSGAVYFFIIIFPFFLIYEYGVSYTVIGERNMQAIPKLLVLYININCRNAK